MSTNEQKGKIIKYYPYNIDCQVVVNVDSAQNQINLYKPSSKDDPKSFTFDNVFGPN